MTVDRGHEKRARVIRRAHLIDVGAGIEQREDGFGETLARRQQQRGEAAVTAHEIGVA